MSEFLEDRIGYIGEYLEHLTFPYVIFKPKVYLDGDKWCALYGDNLQVGVCGFGESPQEACEDFNKEWFKKQKEIK